MATSEDLQFYQNNKALLLEQKNEGFARLQPGQFAGLRNHGATCYLNSLIQCLFHCSEFVQMLFSVTDSPDSIIILEMQKLFARLALSQSPAIDTEPLLVAFGWGKSQLFEQHDIHEFFSVLLDALSQESPFLCSEIARMFQGKANGTTQIQSVFPPCVV
jgi:ubiquitin carboxyl-terminal hydrolase 7